MPKKAERAPGSEFWGHEVCSLSIRNAELTRTLDVRSLELGIVSLILRTENEEVLTCGSGSQDSKLKEWHLFQHAKQCHSSPKNPNARPSSS